MDNTISLAEELLTFVNQSPVSFLAVRNIKERLENEGFIPLSEGDKWDLQAGSSYYVERNSSALIAFTIGKEKPWQTGFNIVGAHTDSPLLKVKNDSLKVKNGALTLNIEAYGGGINSTWLDRELSIAGKVSILNNGAVVSHIVDFSRPIAIIPNLAIHINRDVNKGFEYNKQTHLTAVLSVNAENGDLSLKDIVSKEFNIRKEDILDMDLFFYDSNPGKIHGLDSDLITVGRLDNLAMCHSILNGLLDSSNDRKSNLALFFDHEEIGSQSREGADSNFLSSILDRIIYSLGGDFVNSQQSRFHSFLISADGAHALHPNFADKHDPDYAPKLNNGPVIKLNANKRYSTTAESSGRFISLCKKTDVPYQKLANRSDVPSGSTIGPMTSSLTGIESIDVGNPMWAMHSIRETQGVKDHYYMTKVLTEFYNS